MKIVWIAVLSLLISTFLEAQDAETKVSSDQTTRINRRSYESDRSLLSEPDTALAWRTPHDTVFYNMYGNLRDDNPIYTPVSPWWVCGIRVVMNNVVTWVFDRYYLNADYARIGPSTWKHNLQTGWEWDTDRFGMNFFFHPLGGGGYFNAARANGHTFFESVPFAFGGSLMWEYFGENTLPSYNDLINTTITGAFLGEIEYRLSSNFLDDRTTGVERVSRELFAAVIDPSRGLSRLLQGRLFRVTSEEIYQKEPLNMTFSAGPRWVNKGSSFGTGPMNVSLTLLLDYGNPFEHRSRKIFDYFKIRADLALGAGRKVVDNISGHGLLFGKNVQPGNLDMLIGGFQHYDYWDNKTFELGTIAFGPGMISKLPISATSNLYCDVHLGIVPFAGNSGRLGPDTSQFRDYNYGGGAEGKLETTLKLGGWVGVTLRGYYYWIHTYVGAAGENYIGILKPSIAFRLVGGLSLGFEHLVYYNDRYPKHFPIIHDVRTEQKIFLQFYVDNFKQER